MLNSWQNKKAWLDDFVLLGARVLLAGLFIHESVTLATHFDAAAVSMAKVGVSAPLLAATTALQLGAGAAIAVGWQARLGGLALGLFCMATATLFHTLFGSRDELLHFEKDLAIAGGMLVLWVHGAGRWSLDSLLARRSAASFSAIETRRIEA
jgi:putative oxidoreductase